jgi:hypothetical protein
MPANPTLSINHHLFGVQAFAVRHAFEDDLPPDADGEFDSFLLEDLSRGNT